MSGLTLGADRNDRNKHGVANRGVFLGYLHSNVDFDRGNEGNIDSYSVVVYASYWHDGVYARRESIRLKKLRQILEEEQKKPESRQRARRICFLEERIETSQPHIDQ
ncbi:autotransporter outer membrane beta-barrel domain-containing protein [Salmonella enterica subsp. enterica serovar Saintpaul]|nr:autotransporter outer membrane beta-barrel domain-containing protein [Salmonella enterica subsp. enterica serovar Saintpaul]